MKFRHFPTALSEKCIQCNHLNHKKCAKVSQNELNRDTEYVCTECPAETFPLTNTSTNELLENTYNSNVFREKVIQN